jgi:hypothetical protein
MPRECAASSVGDLNREVEGFAGRKSAARDALGQRPAFHELHHQVRLALVLAHVVDGTNVGMVQRRGRARFALEALLRGRVGGPLRRQELDGDDAAQSRVLGLVHHAHAARAQLLENPVVRDCRTGHVTFWLRCD